MEAGDKLQAPAEEPRAPTTIAPLQIFFAFSGLALSGFGGVMPFAYRALVERRRWIGASEFAGLLALAQVLPGPTICNLSVMIGQRYAGFAGASAALAGMIAAPACIVIALGIAWQHYGSLPGVKHALGGMSAVAIGLILATAVKMGMALFAPASRPAREPRPAGDAAAGPVPSTMTVTASPYWTTPRLARMLLCAFAFAAVGWFRWPLAAVVAALAPFAIALAWFTDPRESDARPDQR